MLLLSKRARPLYVVVDIKYTTLALKAKGELSTSGSNPAYMAQLNIYNQALGRIQGFTQPCSFLLGRGWRQTVKGTTHRGVSCMDVLAPTEHGEAGGLVSEASDWVRRMRRDGESWDVLPQPSVDELRPNAAGDAGVWATAVRKIAEQTGELTMLQKVGVDKRRSANAAGLTDWRDPAVTPGSLGFKPGKTSDVLQALLDVNRTPGPAVRPSVVNSARSEWYDTPQVEFYVDFETVNDLNDDFSAIPNKGGQPLIFMVGCGHFENGQWQFASFVTDQLTENDESAMIASWLSHMTSVRDRLAPGHDPKLIHWSHAEVSTLENAYNSAAARRPGAGWVSLRWFDFLAKVVRAEPVVVQGSHGFGLKQIANALNQQGLIGFRWESGPTDGLGAMVGAWWCQAQIDAGDADRLIDLELMQEIRDYNEIDCKAMFEIVRYLRDNH